MSIAPSSLSADAAAFLAERHLGSLTSLRADGTPHVVAVGFTYRDGIARVITNGASVKARLAPGAVALFQVDGRRWLTLQGRSRVSAVPADVALAEELYAVRYRTPRPNPARVVLLVEVTRVLGSSVLLA